MCSSQAWYNLPIMFITFLGGQAGKQSFRRRWTLILGEYFRPMWHTFSRLTVFTLSLLIILTFYGLSARWSNPSRRTRLSAKSRMAACWDRRKAWIFPVSPSIYRQLAKKIDPISSLQWNRLTRMRFIIIATTSAASYDSNPTNYFNIVS